MIKCSNIISLVLNFHDDMMIKIRMMMITIIMMVNGCFLVNSTMLCRNRIRS